MHCTCIKVFRLYNSILKPHQGIGILLAACFASMNFAGPHVDIIIFRCFWILKVEWMEIVSSQALLVSLLHFATMCHI
jgi:hypothetical protein